MRMKLRQFDKGKAQTFYHLFGTLIVNYVIVMLILLHIFLEDFIH